MERPPLSLFNHQNGSNINNLNFSTKLFGQVIHVPKAYYDNMNTQKKNRSKTYDMSRAQNKENRNERMEVQRQKVIVTEYKVDLVPWRDKMMNFTKMDHVRVNRARIHDWFVEVCRNFKQSWQTLWAAISILDELIIEKGKITIQNLHLYGVVSLFMASKYHEPFNISLDEVLNKICHGKFTKNNILDCENEIFVWIFLTNNNKTLHFPTVQDRLWECFPKITEDQARLIMTELFFCYQAPMMIFEKESVDITEKTLVKEVGTVVLEKKRYQNCQEIENELLYHYGCQNIRRYNKELKL